MPAQAISRGCPAEGEALRCGVSVVIEKDRGRKKKRDEPSSTQREDTTPCPWIKKSKKMSQITSVWHMKHKVGRLAGASVFEDVGQWSLKATRIMQRATGTAIIMLLCELGSFNLGWGTWLIQKLVAGNQQPQIGHFLMDIWLSFN
ncbi:hypothetical protein B0H10DRAFT_1959120 [Mycena sp. CBHHK59/15]|nr:hypothetical protein B0H10DRAFT_1959120 [Mycena sp. CBHHK59/15]